MQNALFDELKDLKKNMKESEKIENERKIKEAKEIKEEKLQDQFLDFVKDSGIKKINQS